MKKSTIILLLFAAIFSSAVVLAQKPQEDTLLNKKTVRQAAQKARANERSAARRAAEGQVATDTTEFIFVIQRVLPSYDRINMASNIVVQKDEVSCDLPLKGQYTNFMRFRSTDFSYKKRVTGSGVTVELRLNRTDPDNTPCRIEFTIPKRGEASAALRMLSADGGSYTFMGIIKPLAEGQNPFVGTGGYSISF